MTLKTSSTSWSIVDLLWYIVFAVGFFVLLQVIFVLCVVALMQPDVPLTTQLAYESFVQDAMMQPGVTLGAYLTVVGGLLLPFTFLWALRKRAPIIQAFSLHSVSLKQFAYYLAGYIALLLAVNIIVVISALLGQPSVFGINGGQTNLLDYFGDQGILLWFTLLSGIVIAPIVEEVVFRGFIHTAIRSKCSNIVSILIVSVIFALFHFEPGVILLLFLFAIYLGWMREHSQSIIPGIIIHMINNLVAFSMLIMLS